MGPKIGTLAVLELGVKVQTNTRSGTRPITRRQASFQQTDDSLHQNRLIRSLNESVRLRDSRLTLVMENSNVLTSHSHLS